ncbi:hypothetical protein GGS23DRAFT_557982 [Durotheca rogersii]|uniref:uncharacterized protein n=1 Tax=Durotheca rogersii TaxID=419775 RepID=UPI00221EB9D7|nr:uncharacterized protein GGS23DRAFT_557982 [Durotheca rogersii]KAI5865163.1 hypothetical protein GGS23DRAFT_557982 [Durotheca rogersii]
MMSKPISSLAASAKAVDPTLDALFASSAGPVEAPPKSRYSAAPPPKSRNSLVRPRDASSNSDREPGDGEDDSEANEELDDESLSEIEEDIEEEDIASEAGEEAQGSLNPIDALLETQKRDRKRKRKDEHDDIETEYLRKLLRDPEEDEEEEEQKEDGGRSDKRRKGEAGGAINERAPEGEDSEEDGAPLIHEALVEKREDHADVEVDKANRTLFLGNISVEAIASSKAKKTLMSHLSSPLSTLDSASGPHKVESIRFRSTAYSTGAMPKRAAFITKSIMSATTRSTNAYVVYSTPAAAQTAVKALNGTVVLDRHMRADSVAHPTAVDHRRCVFVGNLGFVDDETVLNTNAEGETTTKKRTKVPADIEEGLWRVLGKHAGKVESVRVPRDPKTRVGKGFAYVQFYDGNAVESALLLDGKKFPPMLPRTLRISRAKDPRKTALAMERTAKAKLNGAKDGNVKSKKATVYRPKVTPEQQTLAGRAGRLLGRAAAERQRRGFTGEGGRPRDKETVPGKVIKTPEQIVFEGRRASAKDGKPRDLKFGKGKGKKGATKAKTKSRGARRAAEWRKQGAK